jgi:hypothetical protein
VIPLNTLVLTIPILKLIYSANGAGGIFAKVVMYLSFDYSEVIHMINIESVNKELVCLVVFGWGISQEEALGQIELTWNFADDPKLVSLLFPKGNQVIVRASLLNTNVPQIIASTIYELTDQLSNLAELRGLLVNTVGGKIMEPKKEREIRNLARQIVHLARRSNVPESQLVDKVMSKMNIQITCSWYYC